MAPVVSPIDEISATGGFPVNPQQQALFAISMIDTDKLTPNKTKKTVKIRQRRKIAGRYEEIEIENPHYTNEEMRHVAESLNLPITGNRKELYDRIMSELRRAGRI